MKEHIHFAPGLTSIEDVEAKYGPIWDATTLSKIATCPRYHEVRVEMNLEPKERTGPHLVAGIALHLALEYYYSQPRRDESAERMARELCRDEWDHWNLDPTSFDKKTAHYGPDFFDIVLDNYFSYWGRQAIEVFSPITSLRLEDLDLSKVPAARIRLTHDDYVVLGESNFIVLFDEHDLQWDDAELLLAGKPDLPAIKQDGRLYVMDHKTTGSWLSDWWAKTHEMANKDRGYMAMMGVILGRRPHGTVINGITLNEGAHTNPKSKATKFARFQFDFTEDHVIEALRNQFMLKKTAEFYRTAGYYPQTCGFGGCKMPDVCRRDPPTRDVVLSRDYQPSTRTFWDL